MTPGSAVRQREEEERAKEAGANVRQSLALHGGPWGGCQECHGLEEEQTQALGGPEDRWLDIMERWQRHLAAD